MKERRQKARTESTLKIRKPRHFSEAFKRQKVKELVGKQIRIHEVCELYQVSRTSVYRWLYKYSTHHQRGTNQIVEMESEASKTKALRERVKELERAVGRKQLTIDYLEKLIEIANEELGYDIKKNCAPPRSSGSEPIENHIRTD